MNCEGMSKTDWINQYTKYIEHKKEEIEDYESLLKVAKTDSAKHNLRQWVLFNEEQISQYESSIKDLQE